MSGLHAGHVAHDVWTRDVLDWEEMVDTGMAQVEY